MSLRTIRSHAPRLLAIGATGLLIVACSGAAATSNPAVASTPGAATPAAATAAASGTAPTGPGASQGGQAGGAVTTATTAKGQGLVGPNGMSLYIWDKDTVANKSTCNGGCLGTWPPLPGNSTAGSGVTGTLATLTRDDGASQSSYNGKPLYFFSGDTKPGDANGDGIGGTWHLAKP